MSAPGTHHDRDYRGNLDQQRERAEAIGEYEPDELRLGWEQDHQEDIAAERRGVSPKLSMNTNITRAGMPITIRWDHSMGCYRVDAPNLAETGPVQVFTAEEIRAALGRTHMRVGGDVVDAADAIGRVYTELGLERAA